MARETTVVDAQVTPQRVTIQIPEATESEELDMDEMLAEEVEIQREAQEQAHRTEAGQHDRMQQTGAPEQTAKDGGGGKGQRRERPSTKGDQDGRSAMDVGNRQLCLFYTHYHYFLILSLLTLTVLSALTTLCTRLPFR